MEYFFKRLEKYIDVRPSAAMTDIIVKIMVEVLSILGIVTKEVKQGRTSTSFLVYLSPNTNLRAERFFKKLVGMKDVEAALQRLDKLTQEEARMAAAEVLEIARGIDDKVEGVDERVKNVDMKVESIDDKVRGVDSKVHVVDDKVKVVDSRLKGVDNVVKDVDHKVGSVIKGELYMH
jgi:peptidoglycan hydrolase CwlO-like protein